MKMKKIILNIVDIMFICFITICLFQVFMYSENVYDCSNMVNEQEDLFNNLGIKTSIGFDNEHVWLFLHFNEYKIPFESTTFVPMIHPFKYNEYMNPVEEWDNVDNMTKNCPERKYDFKKLTKNEKKEVFYNKLSSFII